MGKENSKLKPTDLKDLTDKTQYTEEELREWYADFLNDYPNGLVIKDDFKKIYGEHFPFGDATTFSEHVFRQFDVNSDGSIDFREFITAFSMSVSGRLENRLKRAFQMYDIDNNGFISRDEMRSIVRSIYKMVGIVDESKSEQRVEHIFHVMDKDNDDRISESEFVNGNASDPTIMKLLQCDVEGGGIFCRKMSKSMYERRQMSKGTSDGRKFSKSMSERRKPSKNQQMSRSMSESQHKSENVSGSQ